MFSKIPLLLAILYLPLSGFSKTDSLENPLLSLDLKEFKGQALWESVQISWTCKLDDTTLDIERLSDESPDFEVIGQFPVTSTDLNVFADPHPKKGINHYRLRKETDNGLAYSEIIAVEYEPVSDIILAPNPCHNELKIVLYSPEDGQFSFQIVDQYGHLAKQESTTLYEGSNTVLFDTSNLVPGIYYWRMVQGTLSVTRPFVKK